MDTLCSVHRGLEAPLEWQQPYQERHWSQRKWLWRLFHLSSQWSWKAIFLLATDAKIKDGKSCIWPAKDAKEHKFSFYITEPSRGDRIDAKVYCSVSTRQGRGRAGASTCVLEFSSLLLWSGSFPLGLPSYHRPYWPSPLIFAPLTPCSGWVPGSCCYCWVTFMFRSSKALRPPRVFRTYRVYTGSKGSWSWKMESLVINQGLLTRPEPQLWEKSLLYFVRFVRNTVSGWARDSSGSSKWRVLWQEGHGLWSHIALYFYGASCTYLDLSESQSSLLCVEQELPHKQPMATQGDDAY
jgi:hypothetical protein